MTRVYVPIGDIPIARTAEVIRQVCGNFLLVVCLLGLVMTSRWKGLGIVLSAWLVMPYVWGVVALIKAPLARLHSSLAANRQTTALMILTIAMQLLNGAQVTLWGWICAMLAQTVWLGNGDILALACGLLAAEAPLSSMLTDSLPNPDPDVWVAGCLGIVLAVIAYGLSLVASHITERPLLGGSLVILPVVMYAIHQVPRVYAQAIRDGSSQEPSSDNG